MTARWACLSLLWVSMPAAADAAETADRPYWLHRHERTVQRLGRSPLARPTATEQAVSRTPAPGPELQPPRVMDVPVEPTEVIPWTRAAEHLNKEAVTVEGVVVEAFKPTPTLVLLRFDRDRSRFYLAVFNDAYERMNLRQPAHTFFPGRRVQATGRVTLYRGNPNMTIRDASRLVVVE